MTRRREIYDAIREMSLDEFVDFVTVGDASTKEISKRTGKLRDTYLQYACSEPKYWDKAEHLAKLGADVNCRCGVWEASPLTHAADLGHVEIIKMLRRHGADFDVYSRPLISPLMAAIREGHLEVVKYLIEEGLDPHLVYRVDQGKLYNALICAEEKQQSKIAEYLREHGCREPIEGVDEPVWELPQERWSKPIPDREKVIHYMTERFGAVDPLGLRELLPVLKGISVTINVIPPNEQHPFLVLFTNGMSDRAMNGHEDWQFAELVIHLPPDCLHPRDVEPDHPSLWPVKLLRQLAYHPHLNDTCYMPPSAIVANGDPPEPFSTDTEFSSALLAPRFANLMAPLQMDDGRVVNFFTVVPLYTDEYQYERKHGIKSLLERMVDKQVPMTVEPGRPSCA